MQKVLSLLTLSFGLVFAYSPNIYISYFITFMPYRMGITTKALFAEPYILPAIIVPFLVIVGIWIARAFFGKSDESYRLLWLIAVIPVIAFGYDSFAKPYLHKNFGWKCSDCEIRAFFRDKVGEKVWFDNFELFKSSPRKFCKDFGKKPNVKMKDVQKYVLILTENIDWLQSKIEEKGFASSSVEKEEAQEAFKKVSAAFDFYKDKLDACWGGLEAQYLGKIGKLNKVQLKLYDELLRGGEV